MRLTLCELRNLNKVHWDRRAWQIGYRGVLLPQQKATGRPHLSVGQNNVALLRRQFAREYDVMRHLANPYLTKQTEKAYITQHGSAKDVIHREREGKEAKRMPGEPKKLNPDGKVFKSFANYGNLLHKHRTVEDSFSELIRRDRWD